jgi:RNase P/RNase MRP subunit p30
MKHFGLLKNIVRQIRKFFRYVTVTQRIKMKKSKWRVGVAFSCFYVIEVESDDAEKAMQEATEIVLKDPEKNVTGQSIGITSCYINDRESAVFANYVPEFIDRKSND